MCDILMIMKCSDFQGYYRTNTDSTSKLKAEDTTTTTAPFPADAVSHIQYEQGLVNYHRPTLAFTTTQTI